MLSQPQPPMTRGLFPRMRSALFGPQSARLTERLHATHWLSYLLVLTQSVAVVLVLGHSLLVLLMRGDWFTRGVAAMGLFVLVSAVYAADMALIATMRRMPALARNRSTWALYEHVAYVAFVLVIEATTFGLVAAILDTNPRAIMEPAPIIPTHGLAFLSQIVCRAVLVAWTAVQLFIVAGKLPPQLSTLLATGKEIVGGHVQRQLGALDMTGATLAAAFQVYAAMSKPPRRIQTWVNGWLVRRDAHREAEEERQAGLVLAALHSFEIARHSQAQSVASERPPTGPGTPSTAPARTERDADQLDADQLDAATGTDSASGSPRVLRLVADRLDGNGNGNGSPAKGAKASSGSALRTGRASDAPASYETAARSAFAGGATSIAKMQAATSMGRSAAASWVRALKAESAGQASKVRKTAAKGAKARKGANGSALRTQGATRAGKTAASGSPRRSAATRRELVPVALAPQLDTLDALDGQDRERIAQ